MQDTWFNPWVRKIPWRRKWQPTPVFLPGEFHGRGTWRATVHGLGAKRLGHNLATKQQQQTLLNPRQGLFSKLVFLPDLLFFWDESFLLKSSMVGKVSKFEQVQNLAKQNSSLGADYTSYLI